MLASIDINNEVINVFSKVNEAFPEIPLSSRYSQEYLDTCIDIPEGVVVRPGMLYEDGVFKEAPIPDPVEIPEEPLDPITPTEFDTLTERIDIQEILLGEILFEIIPEILGGVGGE